MDRFELLKQLTEKTCEYFEQSGLSPVKCRQLVADRMQTWKTLSEEELKEALDAMDT
jgi:hypothetical protein